MEVNKERDGRYCCTLTLADEGERGVSMILCDGFSVARKGYTKPNRDNFKKVVEKGLYHVVI